MKKAFFVFFLLALHSWGASCFTPCEHYSSNPSIKSFPPSFSCSYSNSNYISKSTAWEYPPASYVWDFLETCENTSNTTDPELKSSLDNLTVTIFMALESITFTIGLLTGLFAGRILINIF